ncbi:bifunctional hydroxymethylpyrimidine kinase/phosphomethylpyrimidine kinase [Methanohalobium sp.]|uniref:bifunctional hydroxymethylpyrimidine kinase/phosphomethylpyrimidine kinase n=1 Tax=Methanohalobium sp. TaxID=2837493 RepID=UPI0025EAE4E1|nr:bifunctional hydroxymethylpyrimidine kinase/phosphomethylpyrimidine kinase [Methanohalobium sp.]
MDKIPVAFTIAGSDSGGGAGIEADTKTFAAIGVYGACAITSVTAQNTEGVISSYDLPTNVVSEQIDAVCKDMNVGWAKTGMLGSNEIVKTVADSIKKYNLSIVLDPVMAAQAGGTLLKEDAISLLTDELLPLCKIVTPNIEEAYKLSGIYIKDLNDARNAARKIAEKGKCNVIITGGHLEACDFVYDYENDDFTVIYGSFVEGGTHGSGCTYSSAIVSYLNKGFNLDDAAKYAKQFVENAIKESLNIGNGVNPVNQLADLHNNSERYKVIQNSMDALDLLQNNQAFTNLIPEVGSNIAMAIPNASEISDVAAVEGRIVHLKKHPKSVGSIDFGASSHVARIVLAAMKFNPEIRSAINIKYTPRILDICNELGYYISSFNRADEPEETSTMDWGVTFAISSYGTVPDAIYDKGGIGKEPMIRLLGKSAVDVVNKTIKITEKCI